MIIRTDSGSPPMVGADRHTLVEERDFLLGSLRDLEDEHEAGDIGDVDYQNLRDDYTARAASVLRMLAGEPLAASAASVASVAVSGNGAAAAGASAGAGAASVDPGRVEVVRSDRRWRTWAFVGGMLLVGVLAAWGVAASSGSRIANQPITGTLAGNTPVTASAGQAGIDRRLVQAGKLVQQGKAADALRLYDQILKDRPNDPQALASEGWLIAQAGLSAGRSDLVDQGLVKIEAAEKADGTYPTPHFFRGMLLMRAKGDPAGAVTELRLYLGMVDLSSPEVPQVEQLLRDAIAAAGPNVPPGPNAPPTTGG